MKRKPISKKQTNKKENTSANVAGLLQGRRMEDQGGTTPICFNTKTHTNRASKKKRLQRTELPPRCAGMGKATSNQATR